MEHAALVDGAGRRATLAPADEAALEEITGWLAPELAALLRRLPRDTAAALEELRLRAGRPLELVAGGRSVFLDAAGRPTTREEQAVRLDVATLDRTWQIMCEASVYSRADETRHGFLTLPGGHRVGVAGRVLAEDGRVIRLRDVASLNLRIARERPGCADAVLPEIWDQASGLPHDTLIVSPPGAGKTTLLRDLVRQLSSGAAAAGLRGLRVALVDERSEVAACHRGVPRRDVGPRTDVLDGCPKAPGIQMAIRALSPQVVAFDELGGEADAAAVMEAAYAGVRVLATAHASGVGELALRPSLRALLQEGPFRRVVVLAREPRPGTVRYAGPLSGPGVRPNGVPTAPGVRP